MIRILLLTCGTNACYHITKILKEKFPKNFVLVGIDINKKWLVPTCEYLDKFYQAPFTSDVSYYGFVLRICETEKIDFLIPSFDADQLLFYPENNDLIEIGVKSLGTSKSFLKFYKDKILTNTYLKSINIPVPSFYKIEAIEDEREYFIKPKNGVASIGAEKKLGKEIKKIENYDDYIVQEICKEPEYTQECFFYNDILYSATRERIDSKSGVCTKTRIFSNKLIEEYAGVFAKNTKVPFIFNMQFMTNSKNELVCTDLNLRCAGGMSLSYAAGWDVISSLAKIMLDKPEDEIIKTVKVDFKEKFVVRAYTDIVTKTVKRKIAFDFDGTLLDSRKRHSVVMNDVLKDFSIHLDTSDLVSFKSEKKNNVDWLLSKGVCLEIAEKINREWILKIENEEYLKNDFLYSNSISILESLSKENDLYLITSRKKKQNLFNQIRSLKIQQYFEK